MSHTFHVYAIILSKIISISFLLKKMDVNLSNSKCNISNFNITLKLFSQSVCYRAVEEFLEKILTCKKSTIFLSN